MNGMTNMRSEQNGQTTGRELSTPPDGAQPESVMPSLVALNTWLLAYEDRAEGGREPCCPA